MKKKLLILFVLLVIFVGSIILILYFSSILEKNNLKRINGNDEIRENFETETKSTLQVEKENDNPTNSTNVKTTKTITTSIPSIKEEMDNMIFNVKFIIVDKSDKPVSNLKINLRHLTGDKYNYSPEQSFTDSEGVLYTSIGKKKYEIIIEDKNDNKIYNTFKSTFTVNSNNQAFKFVWPYETPEDRKIREKQGVTFEFKANGKKITNAHIELYVGFYETYDRWTTSYPEIIDLGYSNEEGKIIWEYPKEGKYTVFTYLNEGDDQRKVSKKIIIETKTKDYIVDLS